MFLFWMGDSIQMIMLPAAEAVELWGMGIIVFCSGNVSASSLSLISLLGRRGDKWN
jgi:hypothetical protein